MSWEMEFSTDSGKTWAKIGFLTIGGFNPYRYEYRHDAEWTAYLLHPNDDRRVVPAQSIIKESACRVMT